MVRHGHDQPPLRHQHQPGARRAVQSAGRRVSQRRILSVLCCQRPADLGPGSAAMKIRLVLLAALLTVGSAFAASEADYKAAYAAAEAANKEAGGLRNQWT